VPEVPTIGDTVPGYAMASWFGVIGPARMPAEAAKRIEAELLKALADPAFRDRVQADGTEVVNQGQAQFAALVKADFAKMKRTVELSGARVD
jgi:tripartite-type tricarboxylate transporter receptor subunit TctC